MKADVEDEFASAFIEKEVFGIHKELICGYRDIVGQECRQHIIHNIIYVQQINHM